MFDKISYDIVEFNNGKFGYRKKIKGLFFTRYEFLTTCGRYWVTKNNDIRSRAHFSSLEGVQDMDRANKTCDLDIGIVVNREPENG